MSDPIRELLGVQSPEEVVPYLNFLVYGEPGAGKTYLGATAQDSEDTSPILFLDVEGGTVTIRKRKDVDVVKIRSMEKIEKVHNDLFKAAANGEPLYYKTVIIDSLTELQKLDLRTVMQDEFNRNPDKTDVDVASQRGWGKSGERMRRIIRAYRDLPMNTICTALVGTELDEANGVYNYFPSLPGKLRGEVPGYFDVVGYLSTAERSIEGEKKKEVYRQLQVAKTRRVVAKDRTAALGDIVDSPSIPMLWEMIHAS